MFINCGTQVLPAIVHPTKCCVRHRLYNYVIPEIHPSHTTNVNHINYNHQHYFPHTESVVNEVTNTNTFAPGPSPLGAPVPGFGPVPPRPGRPMFPY